MKIDAVLSLIFAPEQKTRAGLDIGSGRWRFSALFYVGHKLPIKADLRAKIGKEAVQEAQLTNVAKPIIPMLGRLAFRTSYGQNVLRHSMEVAYQIGRAHV